MNHNTLRHTLYPKTLWPQSSTPSFQVCNQICFAEHTHNKVHNKKGQWRRKGFRMLLLVCDNVEEVLEGTRSLWWPNKWMVPPGSGSHQAMMVLPLRVISWGADLPLFHDSSRPGMEWPECSKQWESSYSAPLGYMRKKHLTAIAALTPVSLV